MEMSNLLNLNFEGANHNMEPMEKFEEPKEIKPVKKPLPKKADAEETETDRSAPKRKKSPSGKVKALHEKLTRPKQVEEMEQRARLRA